jgi:hypothetical protein
MVSTAPKQTIPNTVEAFKGQPVPANLIPTPVADSPATPVTVAATVTETATRPRRTVTDAEKLVSYQTEQAKLVKSLPETKEKAKEAQAKLRANVNSPADNPLSVEETQALIRVYGAYKGAHARLEVLNAEIPKLISAVIEEEID